MRFLSWVVGASVVCLELIGCATPYQAMGFQGGYSTVRLDDEVFEIALKSNVALDRTTAERSLLRRAAGVALEHGFTHFVVVGRNRSAGLGFVMRPGVVGPVRQSAQTITIHCYDGPPGGSDAIDAQQQLRSTPATVTPSRQTL